MKIENFDYFNTTNQTSSIQNSKQVDSHEFDIDFKKADCANPPVIGFSNADNSCTLVCKVTEYLCASVLGLC